MTEAQKKCSCCKQTKTVDLFFKNRSHKDGVHHECKVCAVARRGKYPKTPGKTTPEYRHFKGVERKHKLRKWLTDNNSACVICGENDPVCLDFHHSDPSTKEMSMSKGFRTYGIDRVIKEIDKCVLLCANCHRKLHRGHTSLHDLAINGHAKPQFTATAYQ
jgi:hypothetical protein